MGLPGTWWGTGSWEVGALVSGQPIPAITAAAAAQAPGPRGLVHRERWGLLPSQFSWLQEGKWPPALQGSLGHEERVSSLLRYQLEARLAGAWRQAEFLEQVLLLATRH